MTLCEQCEKAVNEVRSQEPPGDWAWDELPPENREAMVDAIERAVKAFAERAVKHRDTDLHWTTQEQRIAEAIAAAERGE